MAKRDDIQIPAAIEAEASAWIVQLDSSGMSARDLGAFREWCVRSPAHAEAIRSAAEVWGHTDILAELAGPIRAERQLERAFGRRRARRAIAAALVSAVALVTIGLVGNQVLPSGLEPVATIQEPVLMVTEVGEQLERRLSDGSKLTLNTDTRLEVDFDRNIRRVRILSGEALFDVAHDSERPFIVYAEGETVRAIGTRFVVRVTDTTVDVTVTEGVVEYAPAKQVSGGLRSGALTPVVATGRLRAGQSIRLGAPDPVIVPINRGEIRRTLAWTDGVLMFSGETLEEVIEELGRYTDDVVVFGDDATREVKVGGVFEIGNMDTLWEALESSFQIDVDERPTGEIYLSSRAG